MAYDARAIANYFLELARSEGADLTPMKLQKLVYFAHGWHLALEDAPLIDEQVEAWAYGPVIRTLYRCFRQHGDKPIDGLASRSYSQIVSSRRGSVIEGTKVPKLDDRPDEAEYVKSLLDRIWEIYGRYSAIQLSNMTHEIGTPWRKVFDEYGGDLPKGTDIPSDVIKRYFQSLRSGATA